MEGVAYGMQVLIGLKFYRAAESAEPHVTSPFLSSTKVLSIQTKPIVPSLYIHTVIHTGQAYSLQ